MNLSKFAKALWVRYLVHGLSKTIMIICVVFLILQFLDWFLRFGFVWRLSFLLFAFFALLFKWYQLKVSAKKPTADELYYFACVDQGILELDADLSQLEISKSHLKPWPMMSLITALIIFLAPLVHPVSRLGWQRSFLLFGQWPKRTQIIDLKYPKIVEQGTPISIELQTEGKIPRVVELNIDQDQKLLVGTGSPKWSYDFFHPPGKLSFSIKAGDDFLENMVVEVLPNSFLSQAKISWLEPKYLGGRSQEHEGLKVKIPEGSQVTLEAQFRNTASLKINDELTVLEKEGRLFYDLGVVTHDLKVVVEGKADPSLSFRQLAIFDLNIKKDQPPQIKLIDKNKIFYVLTDSVVNFSFICEDDYGLNKAWISTKDEEFWSAKISGRYQEIKRQIDLKKKLVSVGDVIDLYLYSNDTQNQISQPEKIRVHVIDTQTFKQRLIESQQILYRELQKLMSSMSRRMQRYEKNQVLEPLARKNSLRNDLKKSNFIAKGLKDYLESLKQLDGFERLISQTSKDQKFFEDNLENLFQQMIQSDQLLERRHNKAFESLKQISKRMAQSQDFHLVLKILDRMIYQQKEVVQIIPAP